jgi:hypothetical protein
MNVKIVQYEADKTIASNCWFWWKLVKPNRKKIDLKTYIPDLKAKHPSNNEIVYRIVSTKINFARKFGLRYLGYFWITYESFKTILWKDS